VKVCLKEVHELVWNKVNATKVFSFGTEFLLGSIYLDNKINVSKWSLI
jgi:hypothetical protein